MKSPHVILKNLQTILRERGAITNTFLMSLVFMLALGAAAPAQLASADRALQSVIGNSQPDVQPAAMNPASEGQQVPDEIANVPGVTEDWWATVHEQIQQEMYALSAEEKDGTLAYRGHNLAHRFDLTFTPDGVRLAPSRPAPDPTLDGMPDSPPAAGDVLAGAKESAGEEWEWRLHLTAFGYEGDIQPVAAAAETVASGNRIEYRRDGIAEWYINDDRGLEQGFAIASPPSSLTSGSLVLEMVLDTGLIPTLTDDAQTIDWTLPDGDVILLRYTDLYVTDATGRQLPSHMGLSGCESDPPVAAVRTCVQLVIDDEGATYPLTVDPLATTTPSWTAQGDDTSFGQAVATAGDVNGDGFADLLIGAWSYTNLDATGKAFVYYGSAMGLSATPAWAIDGENAGDSFGKAVGTAGDVNGDGYDDVIISAWTFSVGTDTYEGKAYVYHGSVSGLSATAAWTKVGDTAGDYYGSGVGTAGDANGDGYDEVIVGAYKYSGSAGRAYVYRGSPSGLSTTPAWTATGAQSGLLGDQLGFAVGTAGDVNGDGYDDVIVGGYRHYVAADYVGQASVYFGSAMGLNAAPDWSQEGENADDRFGYAVGTAGDVNGDGYDDIIVGALFFDSGAGANAGKVYVYLGAEGGVSTTAAWTETGENAGDTFGISVGTAGDAYGGDGYDDVIVGAPGRGHAGYGASDDYGKVYLYGGSEDGLSATPVWTATPEFTVEYLGRAVGTAGDVNGDGYADLVAGGPHAGRVHVYGGSAAGPTGAPNWTIAGENAGDSFGYAVGTAGDSYGGDGFADVVVGAPNHNGDTGKAYFYRGSAAGLDVIPAWTAVGENPGDLFGWSVGTAGDAYGSDGYDDLVVGAVGYNLSAGKAYLFGGSTSGPGDTPVWTASGENAGDRFGYAVGTAGDVHGGDDIADLVVGAYGFPRASSYGKVYVYRGSAAGLDAIPTWTGAGENAGDRFGRSVGTAGDVNADGYDDLIIGAYGYNGNAGKVYVYHGSETGLGGAPAWTAAQYAAEGRFGHSVGTAGDVNGDGYADVIIGGRGYHATTTNACKVYVYHGSVTGLGSTADWIAYPRYADTYFGSSVGTAGDVNGDGFGDVLVGAYGHDSLVGQVYVYHGSTTGLEGNYSYAAAWAASGESVGDRFGSAVGTAGDVNGDGYSDLIIGAPMSNLSSGEAYVYHGGAAGLSAAASFAPTGENASDYFGYAVGTAGDVNGDGFADVVVGARGFSNSTGKAYVYHGSASDLSATPNWTASGEIVGNWFGSVVGTAGDVNGDGYGDLVVGAWGYDGGLDPDAGKVYVYHGSASGLSVTPAWTAIGEDANDVFGTAAGTAGDVNGDGFADVVVGASGYDSPAADNVGKVYVYYGGSMGLTAGAAGWTAVGETADDKFGKPVVTLGDVNGDGYADIAASAFVYPSYKVYVFYGSASGPSATSDWTDIGIGFDRFGSALGTAGDINGDGYADVVIGAPSHDRGGDNDVGQVYVYHGSALGLDAPFFALTGENAGDSFGGSAGTAGDVNGDGYADIVVGAYGHDSFTGKAYVYHGSALGLDIPPTWTATGETAYDWYGLAVGTAGDVNGDGFSDVIIGANSYDDGGNADAGKAFLYYGGDGGGRQVLARQARGDGSGTPVQPWGVSRTSDSFQVSMQVTDPLGRGRAKLQVQACPPGVPFGDGSCVDRTSATWIEVAGASGATLNETITGLNEGVLYRWRARALYDSPLVIHGPWRRFLGQAVEADLRSMELPTDLMITKTVAPSQPVVGQPITYTLAYLAAGGPAAGVVITDIIPSDITNITVISTGVTIADTGASPGYVWRVDDLAAGEGGVITISGVAGSTRFFNTAVITTTSPELDPGNNVSTVQTHMTGVIFVDRDATGPTHDGLTWITAYTELQDALNASASGDEIWVAEGVYMPTNIASRTATFQMVDSVGLYGGFSGTEVWRHERDWATHPTILSGDIGTTGNSDDNAYHVVTGSGATDAAALDGFTITGGNADGSGAEGMGGGLYISGGSPMVLNVNLVGNAAGGDGGGVYNTNNSEPTLTNVALSGNAAGNEGGGMYNAMGSDPTLTNVTFSGNTAGSRGGGLYNEMGTSATVRNSILWGNAPDQIIQEWYLQINVSYSDVEGGWPGTEIIDADPRFYDADGLDNTPGTLDDDLRLRHDSPVIDIGDDSAIPADALDLDGDGDTSEPLPLDLSGRSRLIGFTVVAPAVDMGAYEANILDVIATADAFLDLGMRFRAEQVQLLSADTAAEALQNYQNFNDGELFYDFCADYGQIDDSGYCPDDTDRQNVRNTLFDAIELYVVALGWPTTNWTTHDGREIEVQDIGGSGVVSAAHEIANVHLIFGNEFLVDAIDYRFSTGGIPYADEIINKELEELEQAKRQFELTMDLLFRAFGGDEWGVGAHFTSSDFETFGVASSRMMTTMDELAARYRMLGDDQAALDIYDRAYEEQYMQLTALAQMAQQVSAEYLQNGSYEMFNNLSQMRDRAQAIRDGLDFFGFSADYVPLQSYDRLLILTEGPTGNTGLLSTARDLEDQAREAQRTYDTNASDMDTELYKMVSSYNLRLFDLCGASEDADGDGRPDYDPCEGGLIERNLIDLDSASLRVGLAWMKAQNIVERIQIEQQRVEQIIQVDLGLAQSISAIDLAIGKLNAFKETFTQMAATEHKIYAGGKVTSEAYAGTEVKGSANPFASGAEVKSGVKVTIGATVGFESSGKWVSSANVAWVPNAEEIGQWASIKTLQQAEARAEILGANSAATIRNLLLQQSQALIEYEIAMAGFNKLAAEHNHLAGKVSLFLNKRFQATNKVARFNSHLLSPAYRIMRDTLTIQSAEAHGLAAQFAYLTARAAEYELLTPYPARDSIYQARTSNDIRLFLDDLAVWYQALNRPGQLNRYPYAMSFARDILGLTDQNLDPSGALTAEELDRFRYELFQQYLQDQIFGDGRLEFPFSTSLDQQLSENQYLFSPNIWNNRIAGIGEPLAGSEGLSLNIITRQTGDVGTPEILLIHDGQTSYRNASDQVVYLDPGTAVPVGYVLPEELDPENTTIVLRPGINGVGAVANSGLINLSVAASSWTLIIPADSMGGLDLGQIEDIEFQMDTTGRALPGLQQQATQDALLLQAGLELEPVSSERARQLAVAWANELESDRLPELSLTNTEGIGGSYYGSVVVTSPLTLSVQVLNFALVNLNGTLSGTLDISETALYNSPVGLHGIAVGDAFTVTSDIITNTVFGRPVQRWFTLAGNAVQGGRVLQAAYTAVISDLLPSPVVVQGRFSASRPGTPGSERLVPEVAAASVHLHGSTAITVTHLSVLMELITETNRITFTTDLGTVTPVVVDTIEGVVTATYRAGGTPGQATILATTGEVTYTVLVEIEAVHHLYLPMIPHHSDLASDVAAGITEDHWADVHTAPVSAPHQAWSDLVRGDVTPVQPGDPVVLAGSDACCGRRTTRAEPAAMPVS